MCTVDQSRDLDEKEDAEIQTQQSFSPCPQSYSSTTITKPSSHCNSSSFSSFNDSAETSDSSLTFDHTPNMKKSHDRLSFEHQGQQQVPECDDLSSCQTATMADESNTCPQHSHNANNNKKKHVVVRAFRRMLYSRSHQLRIACEEGNTALILSLSDEEEKLRNNKGKVLEVECKDADGNTPLHLTSVFGHTETCRVLIEKGANVNCTNNYDYTPLHLAAANNHYDIAVLLIQHGADVNFKSRYKNETPLHCASHKGHVKVVKLLLDSMLIARRTRALSFRGDGSSSSRLSCSTSVSGLSASTRNLLSSSSLLKTSVVDDEEDLDDDDERDGGFSGKSPSTTATATTFNTSGLSADDEHDSINEHEEDLSTCSSHVSTGSVKEFSKECPKKAGVSRPSLSNMIVSSKRQLLPEQKHQQQLQNSSATHSSALETTATKKKEFARAQSVRNVALISSTAPVASSHSSAAGNGGGGVRFSHRSQSVRNLFWNRH